MIYDIDYYKDEIHCLYDEKKELQARIDKAIEYIEDICLDEDKQYCYDLCGKDIYKVLDILKGSDSND